MTGDDHHPVMKRVRIADLKARLSEHVREVRRGYPSLQRVPLPPPARLKGDAVALLLEDRDADR
jgi:hypothetical protein